MNILRCLVLMLLWPWILRVIPAEPSFSFRSVVLITLLFFLVAIWLFILTGSVIMGILLPLFSLYLFQGLFFYFKIVTEDLTEEEWVRVSIGLSRAK